MAWKNNKKQRFNRAATDAARQLKRTVAEAIQAVTSNPAIIDAIVSDDSPESLYRRLVMSRDMPKVIEGLKNFDEHVAALNAAFDQMPAAPQNKEWVKAKLKHMVEVDQYSRGYDKEIFARHSYSDLEKEAFRMPHLLRAIAIDMKNTADMNELIGLWGWFTISQFGKEADSNAWLLVQHADYARDFQEKVLGLLEKLYPQGETSPANYAYLYDRVALSFNDAGKRKLQRYGTQLTRGEAGAMMPAPVEDPEHLDERRQQMGLKPIAEYLKRF
ncbi:MAG: hypothetical protein K8R48_05110 [Alphaproteobacteria bacterium]|nr:hypothetical protein [Alphaproteobacteria bacterium]